jgi:hypothetical protein
MIHIIGHRLLVFNIGPVGFDQLKTLPMDIGAHKGSCPPILNPLSLIVQLLR